MFKATLGIGIDLNYGIALMPNNAFGSVQKFSVETFPPHSDLGQEFILMTSKYLRGDYVATN